MRISDTAMLQIARQTILAGLTVAATNAISDLNAVRSQLGLPPMFTLNGDNGETFEAEPPARRGRPPGSINGTGRMITDGGKRVYKGMAERRALVKRAGMVLRGSPSEADAQEAQRILAKRGEEVPSSPDRKSSPDGKSSHDGKGLTLRQQNLAVVKLAGFSYRGSPNSDMIARARKLLAKRGTPLPPELVAAPVVRKALPRGPMSDEMKDKLRSLTAERWRKVTEAGLLGEAGGKLPSNDLVAKAERILKNRQKRVSALKRP